MRALIDGDVQLDEDVHLPRREPPYSLGECRLFEPVELPPDATIGRPHRSREPRIPHLEQYEMTGDFFKFQMGDIWDGTYAVMPWLGEEND
jgi:hypothetical protein